MPLCLTLFSPLLLWPGSLSADEAPKEIDDFEITDAVENEFLYDRFVPFNDIDVTTSQGIVTLSGEASNILGKERSGLVAETVRGVRSVVNLIEVEGPEVPGEKLKERVERALVRDPAADSYEVDVSADQNGTVTLEGTVDSWQESRLTEIVVKGVRGVTGVENQMEVEYRSDRADHEIQTEVEKRLAWDALVDDGLVTVEVTDGDVSLSGKVGSAAEKRVAVNGSWVGGVQSVDASDLEVVGWVRDESLRKDKYLSRPDDEVRAALLDAFLYDPRVVSFEIDPKVSFGWVTLRGVVDNAKARQAAERVAHRTVGVTGVTNRIKVRPEGELSAAAIEENIVDGILADPWIHFFEIDVDVVAGTAYLRGTVDSWFEKSRAETVAQGARGVQKVRNQIEVSDPESSVVYDPYVWDTYPVPWTYYPYYPPVYKENRQRSDEQITAAIEDEIFWSPFVDSDDVNIDVSGGVATLTGTVDSRIERAAATENAFEGGAVGVINEIDLENL